MRAEKKERKRARKKIGYVKWQKKNKAKFWLMSMHRIEILHNFVPNLQEIYLFLVKKWPS